MHDICTYHIELQGQVEEKDLSRMTPTDISVIQKDSVATQFAIHADQSGLIGLLRHLHGKGFVLLSVTRE